MKDIYSVLDIGSSTIKFLVGESINSSLNVLFSKKVPSHGVKKGIIEDQQVLVEDIKKVIEEAENFLETKINSVGLNITTSKAKLYRSDSSISLGDSNNVIEQKDIARVMGLSAKFKRDKDEEIVSIIPVRFQSDQGSSVEAPLGQKSRNLIVDTLIITTKKKILYPYIEVVEKAGLEVVDIGINAFSCAKEAFDKVYLQEGAVLIDIGYKTSTISFYEDGYLKYLTVCSVGGYDFTRAIAQELVIKMDQAEAYKIKYGSLDATLGQEDVIHTKMIPDGKKDYTQRDLAEILSKTAYQVMEEINEKLQVINDVSKYEILIVGGGGELEMIDKIASDVFKAPVRVYRPDIIGIRDMAFVSAAGMIYYMMERARLLGPYPPAVVFPDITNTMSLRFKGLTKTGDGQTNNQGKLGKLIANIFSEDD